jgi:hypothetical protein
MGDRARGAMGVPPAVSDADAALFAIAAIVMNGIRRGKLVWGETVVVLAWASLVNSLSACTNWPARAKSSASTWPTRAWSYFRNPLRSSASIRALTTW